MSTQAPKCSLCGHRHGLGAPHVWSTKGKEKPANVATINKKNVIVAISKPNVATIRQVSIRELNKGISKHFSNLPFEVTKRGIVIAKVTKP